MVFSRAAHLTAFTNQQQSTAEVSVNSFTPLSYKPLCAIPILHLTYNPHVILHNMTSWWVSSGFPHLLQTSHHNKLETECSQAHSPFTAWLVANVHFCPRAQLLSPAERPILGRQAEHCSSQGQDGTSSEHGTAQDGWRDGSSTVNCWLLPAFNCSQHLF